MEKCFVISVIGKKGSDERKYADQLFKHIILPAAKRAGYDEANVKRADHFDEQGMITVQVVNAILNYDMVVADLTHSNPNVYYELAIRHQTGKPIVQMMMEGTELPFDVAQVRTVPFGMDLDEVEIAKDELLKKLISAKSDPSPVVNPITQAKEIAQLKSGPNEQYRTLGLIVETQSAILAAIKDLKDTPVRLDSGRAALEIMASLGAGPRRVAPQVADQENKYSEVLKANSDHLGALLEKAKQAGLKQS
jgi:hypothetical protein